MKLIIRARRMARLAIKIAWALLDKHHPVLVHLIPMRRCNLACRYCNEYDAVSAPVPLAEMLRRVDLLAGLGTSAITISGGEPLMHPELDAIVARIRGRGMVVTLITNGYHLSPERIERLNRAGLDHLEISIDNVEPDDVSMKSLRLLEPKLVWLREHAEFSVAINSVVGSGIKNPEDALQVARRARELGFISHVGVIHDGRGQVKPLAEREMAVYRELRSRRRGPLRLASIFQDNLGRGPAQRVELPGRGPLPLRGRERPRPLLLAAARPARPSRWRPTRRRTSSANTPRPRCARLLHDQLRAMGRAGRQLALAAGPAGGGGAARARGGGPGRGGAQRPAGPRPGRLRAAAVAEPDYRALVTGASTASARRSLERCARDVRNSFSSLVARSACPSCPPFWAVRRTWPLSRSI
jgi:organic radical activating enzyme